MMVPGIPAFRVSKWTGGHIPEPLLIFGKEKFFNCMQIDF
jgi:hypothetical protein